MLEYLVTSRARRALLKLLWHERRTGSTRGLARDAGVSVSLANHELKEMAVAGLATARVVGAARVYSANFQHPQAELLKKLLASTTSIPAESKDQTTRQLLVALGAPLVVDETASEAPKHLDLEETLVSGLALARRDPSVARALPVLFARRLKDFDLARLERLARQLDHRRLLGFFAELTGVLRQSNGASARELSRLAKRLTDARNARSVPFFETLNSRFDELLMEQRTPEVAKRWHYRMNLPLKDFQAFFDKHQET